MFAEIKLVTEVKKNAIAVPSECIVRRDGESVVFVLENYSIQPPEYPTVTQRRVKTGISVDNVTEIIEGLEPSETVVSRGQTLLENGAQVQVVDTKAETGTGEGGAV
jgi:hypothetical protein